MITRLSLPLRLALIACAVTVAASVIVACTERGVSTAPALLSNRISAMNQMRVVRLRPVLANGQTADVPPIVVHLMPVASDEPVPAEK